MENSAAFSHHRIPVISPLTLGGCCGCLSSRRFLQHLIIPFSTPSFGPRHQPLARQPSSAVASVSNTQQASPRSVGAVAHHLQRILSPIRPVFSMRKFTNICVFRSYIGNSEIDYLPLDFCSHSASLSLSLLFLSLGKRR